MTDGTPDTGDVLLDCLLFAAVTAVGVGAAILGCHVLNERLKRKHKKQTKELDV